MAAMATVPVMVRLLNGMTPDCRRKLDTLHMSQLLLVGCQNALVSH